MDLRRLRPADWLTAIAAVALLVLLALGWFDTDASATASTTGYSSLGWFLVALLVLCALGGLLLAALTASTRLPDAFPVAVQVTLAPFASLTTLVLLVVLLLQPGLGAGLPNAAVSLQWPAYVGLLAQLALAAGAWRSMSDERTDARHSAYTPPPARPVPPATA